MPTVNLRNTSGEPLFLGSADGRRVDVDEVVHVEGVLSKSAPDDAYIVTDEKTAAEHAWMVKNEERFDLSEDEIARFNAARALDPGRAYPKSTWTNAGGASAKQADVPAPDTKEN